MRYKAEQGSVLGHGCCFDGTVVDTSKVHNFSNDFEVVCECHEFETAQKIAKVLNEAEVSDAR